MIARRLYQSYRRSTWPDFSPAVSGLANSRTGRFASRAACLARIVHCIFIKYILIVNRN